MPLEIGLKHVDRTGPPPATFDEVNDLSLSVYADKMSSESRCPYNSTPGFMPINFYSIDYHNEYIYPQTGLTAIDQIRHDAMRWENGVPDEDIKEFKGAGHKVKTYWSSPNEEEYNYFRARFEGKYRDSDFRYRRAEALDQEYIMRYNSEERKLGLPPAFYKTKIDADMMKNGDLTISVITDMKKPRERAHFNYFRLMMQPPFNVENGIYSQDKIVQMHMACPYRFRSFEVEDEEINETFQSIIHAEKKALGYEMLKTMPINAKENYQLFSRIRFERNKEYIEAQRREFELALSRHEITLPRQKAHENIYGHPERPPTLCIPLAPLTPFFKRDLQKSILERGTPEDIDVPDSINDEIVSYLDYSS